MIKRLATIQQKLKAPKGQFNNFGKYNYRSCEDILEAVKPLLGNDVALIVRDKIILIGDRYYVEATAELTDGEKTVSATAYAREENEKKGMDASQLTGATSSYARKYALNGLLLIDDTKDADSRDNREKPSKDAPKKEEPKPEPPKPDAKNNGQTLADNKPLKAKVEALIGEANISRDMMKQWLYTSDKIGVINDVPSLNTMTVENAKAMIDKWPSVVTAFNKWIQKQAGGKE